MVLYHQAQEHHVSVSTDACLGSILWTNLMRLFQARRRQLFPCRRRHRPAYPHWLVRGRQQVGRPGCRGCQGGREAECRGCQEGNQELDLDWQQLQLDFKRGKESGENAAVEEDAACTTFSGSVLWLVGPCQ
jgi:hypothetical protein